MGADLEFEKRRKAVQTKLFNEIENLSNVLDEAQYHLRLATFTNNEGTLGICEEVAQQIAKGILRWEEL